jgi:hypothetical protein|tara:strand:- start:187 stop:645 length:459 start_codon:yes stop_codon:yes gene_type:complete
MNTNLVIVTVDKKIGIGSTTLSDIESDMSWIPSDVWAVSWNGSTGEIEYNDGKPNLGITSIGIYSQAETTFNNELQRLKDLDDAITSDPSFQWGQLRKQRNSLLFMSDYTQLNDAVLTDSKKTEWINYRQQLRDLPSNTSDPANPTWPTEPS